MVEQEKIPLSVDIGFGDDPDPRVTLGIEPPFLREFGKQFTQEDVEDIGFFPIEGRAEQLPFRSGSLNFVTSQSVLGAEADLDEGIMEAVRVLRPGGTAELRILIDEEFVPEFRGLLRTLSIKNVSFKTRTPRSSSRFDPEFPDPMRLLKFTKV